jgi:hypothetical protein
MPTRRLIIQFEGFGNGDAGGAIYAADDGGVIPRGERHQDDGFAIVGRREGCRLDLGGIGGIAPVVVVAQ